MAVRDHVQRQVRTIEPGATLRAAAQRMADENVGCLVAIANERARGVVTDRDLALRVIRDGLDPDATTVSELFGKEPAAIVHEQSMLRTAMALMRRRGVRRLVVLDDQDHVAGILALDDLVRVLAGELSDAASVLEAQSPRRSREGR